MSRYLSSHGYIAVAEGGRHTYEHRLVMERVLGKPIPKGMVVHHLDHNKQNNAPSNLMLMTQAEHMQHHRETFVNKTHKQCSKCWVTKPRSEFTTNSSYKISKEFDPNHSWCQSCFNQVKRSRLKRIPRNTQCMECHQPLYRYPYQLKSKRPTYCKPCADDRVRGESSPRSKLTEKAIRIIRSAPRGVRGQTIKLARRFHVATSTIQNLRNPNSTAWPHIR